MPIIIDTSKKQVTTGKLNYTVNGIEDKDYSGNPIIRKIYKFDDESIAWGAETLKRKRREGGMFPEEIGKVSEGEINRFTGELTDSSFPGRVFTCSVLQSRF